MKGNIERSRVSVTQGALNNQMLNLYLKNYKTMMLAVTNGFISAEEQKVQKQCNCVKLQ